MNAGHLPILLRQGHRMRHLESSGLPFGLMTGATYACGHEVLEPGDMFLVTTDGVTEAGEGLGLEDFGLPRLEDHLRRAEGAEPALVAVMEDLRCHLQGGSPGDDVTLLCARVV